MKLSPVYICFGFLLYASADEDETCGSPPNEQDERYTWKASQSNQQRSEEVESRRLNIVVEEQFQDLKLDVKDVLREIRLMKASLDDLKEFVRFVKIDVVHLQQKVKKSVEKQVNLLQDVNDNSKATEKIKMAAQRMEASLKRIEGSINNQNSLHTYQNNNKKGHHKAWLNANTVNKYEAPMVSSEHVYTDGLEKLRILKQLRAGLGNLISGTQAETENKHHLNSCSKINFRENCKHVCPFKDEFRLDPCICRQYPKAYCVEEKCEVDEGEAEEDRTGPYEPCLQRWVDAESDEEVTGLCKKPEQWNCDLNEVFHERLSIDEDGNTVSEVGDFDYY